MYPRIILFILFPLFGFSQAPQKINFQSILRNTNGEVVANKSVSLKISILSGSISGSSVYSETHTKTTDASGLISLQIGNGTALNGVFGNIDWGSAAHFIKLEADFNGGSNYVVLGTQELMSVPYALYASKTDTNVLNLTNRLASKLNVGDTISLSNRINQLGGNQAETDPVFNVSVAKGITALDTAYWNNKLASSDTISLSNRMNGKLNILDTATMLTNYRNGLNDKVNVSDTSSMLANYRTELNNKAPINNPSFTGTVTGIDKNMVGLGNVDNTSDVNKPISTATQTALNNKLNISDFPLGTATGNIQYWNGTTWVNLAPGQNGQTLILVNGIPSWSGAAYPTLTTSSVSSITSTSVSAGGNISSDGGAPVSARGLVYGTSVNPTLSNTVLTIGSGTGGYSGTLTGLIPNTTYYIRAYATNIAGTGYGNEVTFQTLPVAVPILITTDASGITQTTVTSGGTISNDGGATITERGIVYGTSTNPTTSNTKVMSGSGTGSFSVNVSTLTPNTTYYIRSYAINSAGTGYGNNITFQTSVPAVPSLTTRELLNITNTTATGGGSITNDGGSSITAKGICWGTSPNPTIADSKTTDGTGTAIFTSFITGLSANITYYVRAYATNGTGTGYGNQQTFTSSSTSNTLPVVTSTSVTGLTTIQATFNAEVNSQGGGTVTERGAVWNTSGNPTVNSNRVPSGSGTGVYTTTITGLSGGSNYYVRAYAINNFGISYGVEIPFTTTFGLAILTTNNVIAQSTTASSGGNITDNGGSTISARGVVWNTTGTPIISDSKTTDGSGTGSYVSNLTGLSPSTTYYVRAYATNNTGTAYGNQQTFTTSATSQMVTDIDGNTYNTIQIGTQTWMSENLKTSRYRNGGSIPYVVGNSEWQALTTGAWSYYNHDEANNAIYGKLYNWFTTRGDTLCPLGWHVPSDTEWTTLTTYLGGEAVAGGKMKSIAYWNSPNTGTTNESGFSAFPGGYRNNNGQFYLALQNTHAFFWSITEIDFFSRVHYRGLYNTSEGVDRGGSALINGFKIEGASIRCIKNEKPSLTTINVIAQSTTASIGGNITDNGGLTVTARGVVWNTTGTPTISDSKTTDGSGSGSYVSYLTGLSPSTTYYVRAYATNSIGTGYGNEITFTTTTGFSPTVTDIDGNTYNTVTIGTQVWMSENLKTTRYRNGGLIPNVVGNTEWQALTTGAWSYYNHDEANNAIYGKLYNWYTTQGDTLCPLGWHVPSFAEWRTLTTYLDFGGEGGEVGGKMKSVGTAYWIDPNTGATNESGFSALPGGVRGTEGSFGWIGTTARFWSSFTTDAGYGSYAIIHVLTTSSSYVTRNVAPFPNLQNGYSVRCLKD